MSTAQKLWDNWCKYDDLDSVYRQGFLKIRLQGFGPDAKKRLEKNHIETVLAHSARAAMLFSDMMDLYPGIFKDLDGADKYAALKVALTHDLGERIVGDVCDDGRKEHELKKGAESEAIAEHYFGTSEEVYLQCASIHRSFENLDTLLGQAIKVADKLDFLAKLIRLHSQGYCMSNKQSYFSKGDIKFAKETRTYNFIDACANHFRHQLRDGHFDQRLQQIAVQFLTCGLSTINRPFFWWWNRIYIW